MAYRNKEYRPFQEARKYVHKLGTKTREDWKEYCDTEKNHTIFQNIQRVCIRRSGYNRKFRPFEDARKFVYRLGLKTDAEWNKYCKSGLSVTITLLARQLFHHLSLHKTWLMPRLRLMMLVCKFSMVSPSFNLIFKI